MSFTRINDVYQIDCSMCTYINKRDALFCQMCQSPLAQHPFASHSRRLHTITRIQSIDDTVVPDDLSKDLKKAKFIRESIINSLKVDEKFVDPEFPPCHSSIGKIIDDDNLSSMGGGHNLLNKPVQWLRPDQLRVDEYGSDSVHILWTVTRNPSSEDIVQGRLGNCWLMTGLALIADKSILLNRILITKEIDPYGIYQVRLCKDGIWTVVTIDDLFPANQFDEMTYSRANRKQLWVSLIEKAAAKLYGSYEALTLGYCADGLSTLTGSPCETLKLSDLSYFGQSEKKLNEEIFGPVENISYESEEKDTSDTAWAKLLSANEADFVMCASCGSQSDSLNFPGRLQRLGLSNLHAYAILDVRDIPDINVRLIRLKNPWARLTWRGKWSDCDENWNRLPNDLRNELQPVGVSGESCGVFWISWEDILTYFFAIDICRCQSYWSEIRMQTHLPWPIWVGLDNEELYMNNESNDIKAVPETNSFIRSPSPIPDIETNNTCGVLTVLEPTNVQIVLWQSVDKSENGKPVDLLLTIFEGYKEPLGCFIASSNRQTSSYVVCDTFLNPGIYSIFYMSLYHWQLTENVPLSSQSDAMYLDFISLQKSSPVLDCTLSIHSSKAVLLHRAILTPNMIPQVICELAFCKGRVQLFGNSKVYTLMKGYSGLIMVFVNPSDSYVKCTSDSKGSVNVRSSRGNLSTSTDDIISPKYCQIINILTQDDAYSSFSLQIKYSVSTTSLNIDSLQNRDTSRQHSPPILNILHRPLKLPITSFDAGCI